MDLKKSWKSLKGLQSQEIIRPIFAFVIISKHCCVTNLNLIHCSYAGINC